LAERVRRVASRMGFGAEIQHIENPRKELEDHYYNPAHRGLIEMGLEPHPMTDDVVAAMLERVATLRERIVVERILPRVRWR
jgi:UDP-sulfoquinovose synthase